MTATPKIGNVAAQGAAAAELGYTRLVLTNQLTYQVGPETPFAASVDLGEEFTLHTLDASGDQVREGVSYDTVETGLLFPVSGPVEVRGVRAGDRVGIGVRGIRCAPVGHVWTRPGLGFSNPGWFDARQLSITPPVVRDRDGLEFDYAPHVGTLGVLPQNTAPARTLGQYGGNVDVPDLGPGAMLWVTATHDGAGVFAGDIHAAIGDGEVCGTGVETSAEVDLVVARTNCEPTNPAVMTRDRTWLIGVGENFEAALGNVLSTVVQALSRKLKIPEPQAYLTTSLLLDVRPCQVVNPQTSVAVSLRRGLDACLVTDEAHQTFQNFLRVTAKGE